MYYLKRIFLLKKFFKLAKFNYSDKLIELDFYDSHETTGENISTMD
jgi:hypothetical protein